MGLKIFGGAVVIFAGTWTGYQMGERLRKRIEQLRQQKRLILLLNQEIVYRNSTFEEAFLETAKKMPCPYSEVLHTLSMELKRPGEKSLSEWWQKLWRTALKETELKEADIEKFCQLGVQLGYPDVKMQESALKLFLEQLEWEIERLLGELPEKRKLCRCLGACVGLLVTIVLL